MDDLGKLAEEKELQKFQDALGVEQDPVMLVLRAHLFSENLLERLILSKLPRGDKLIENGNLTYHQKLALVDALDCMTDSIVSALRNLNKLRNQCAHELDKKISETDIVRIGSPLGKKFTDLRRRAQFDETILLRTVINYIAGFVAGCCFLAEHQPTNDNKTKDQSKVPGIDPDNGSKNNEADKVHSLTPNVLNGESPSSDGVGAEVKE